jgi:hypothetical protein
MAIAAQIEALRSRRWSSRCILHLAVPADGQRPDTDLGGFSAMAASGNLDLEKVKISCDVARNCKLPARRSREMWVRHTGSGSNHPVCTVLSVRQNSMIESEASGNDEVKEG